MKMQPIADRDRGHLHAQAAAALGADAADTLMAHLPPTGWHDLATKQDLQVLRSDLLVEIASVRTAMWKMMAALLLAQSVLPPIVDKLLSLF